MIRRWRQRVEDFIVAYLTPGFVWRMWMRWRKRRDVIVGSATDDCVLCKLERGETLTADEQAELDRLREEVARHWSGKGELP